MFKKVKKSIAIVLACAMMFSFSACGDKEPETTAPSTTEANKTWDDLFEALGGKTTEEVTTEDESTEEVTTEDGGAPDLEAQAGFEELTDRYYKESITTDTISYHYSIKDGSSIGIEPPAVATLGETGMTDEDIAADKKETEADLAELLAINYSGLTDEQKFDYNVLKEYIETELMIYDNVYLYEPFSPMNGLQEGIATYFTDYQFYQKSDVDDYIALLNDVRRYFDEYLEFEKVKADKGTFMSLASAEKVIEQCQTFTKERDNHFMISVFEARIDELDFLTDEEKDEYKKQNREAVANSLLPAFDDVEALFTELKDSGVNQQGVCYFENGKEHYAYLLKHYTGTAKTPEEVIEMLDGQFSSLMTDLYTIYMTSPDVYDYFSENYDNLFEAADNMTVDEMIDTLMVDAAANYPNIGKIPYKTNFLDKSLETIMENTLAYYMSPAIDDPDNNLIYVNGLHMDGLWTTLAHEGFPGHMYQNTYYMQTNPNPVRTLFSFLGYKEGWAMYTCYDAVNAYSFDGSSNAAQLAALYQINDELSYLLMGRVDIGVNYEGWTVEDTKNYINSMGFNGDAAGDIYETVTGDPALYQSYVTGYYELKELSDYAESKLGAKYSKYEFNKTVLDAGPCQYDLLKQKVDEYIKNAK